MKKLDLIQEIMSTRKPRQKKIRLKREKRKKRYNWIAISFEEIIRWECNFYE